MSSTAPAGTWAMYRAMVGVGLVCGALIVGVFQWTRPRIARNRAEALEAAILAVLPEARSSVSFALDAEGDLVRSTPDDGGPAVHAGYDGEGRLVGIAIEAKGMGYQDVLHLLYGYSFARQEIVGMRVLESRETPGLGDRIESDPGFLANFVALDVRLDEGGRALAHPVEFVKGGTKEHPWQVDGITGATVSSVAVADILRESTSFWLPRLHGRLDALRSEGTP